MFNCEEDYLEDIATLNNQIAALKAENEYLRREAEELITELKALKKSIEDSGITPEELND